MQSHGGVERSSDHYFDYMVVEARVLQLQLGNGNALALVSNLVTSTSAKAC